MKTSRLSLFLASPLVALLLALFGLTMSNQNLFAANLKLEIYLIWGSNSDKLPDPKYKRLDNELAKKLQKIFKWKYYFEISKQNADVPSRSTKKIKVSDKCEIEITEMEGPRVEVKLYGEGKLINKTIKALTKDELFTLAGEDKDETAWFVIIKLLEES